MRSYSYLNTARIIIEKYDGNIPLSQWLKNFYSSNKKYGSKDRKIITELCYSYFRSGMMFNSLSLEDKMISSLFLTSTSENIIFKELKPEWVSNLSSDYEEKLSVLGSVFSINLIFPFHEELSNEIDVQKFGISFLIQPDVFLRIRPGKNKIVLDQLIKNQVSYIEVSRDCIQISNSSAASKIIKLDEDAVIQDINSQKSLQSLLSLINSENTLDVWDTCAASGGKSILFIDLFPMSKLTVSDIRKSILFNLQKRFRRAGIKSYNYFEADLSNSANLPNYSFDVIICDVPCSGSGTWSRTPEQVSFFNYQKLNHYTQLQRSIALNASKRIKKNGYLLYVTCSVFAAENEEAVIYIQNNTQLMLISFQYLKGYEHKSDTLFTALFKA